MTAGGGVGGGPVGGAVPGGGPVSGGRPVPGGRPVAVGGAVPGGLPAATGLAVTAGGAVPGGGVPAATGPARPGAPRRGARVRAWAELLRVSALFSVPGDALAGAAAVGARPGRGTALAIGASLCLYEAGMALNDWADRAEDAVDRPHRPLPSGRVAPGAALAASAALTAGGLAFAARAGRAPLAVATALAATVWAYDLRLKHTPAGPAAMAAARALDLLLGATATAPPATAPPGAGLQGAPAARALAAAGVLGAHTWAVTAVSRHEAHGGSTAAPLTALAVTAALGARAARPHRPAGAPGRPPGAGTGHRAPAAALGAAAYLRTAGPPLLHAALNPSAPLTRRAVGGGIRAMIPLQAALAARAGAPGTGLALLGLAPLARALARKVSPT
ncbi:SCO3242 family prenyltransferase [Streptomyces sp. NPDC015131]|uniref:SCO3242 family prenyltransferase n=1 Tax=Streptomyces sp. NPDC015131 TaxID=3364941 RepID=UPI0036FD758B